MCLHFARGYSRCSVVRIIFISLRSKKQNSETNKDRPRREQKFLFVSFLKTGKKKVQKTLCFMKLHDCCSFEIDRSISSSTTFRFPLFVFAL
mmetsp:Transcript_1740/g.2090  ORF Transcript_1740/g.2090 Transcript_1740/m.2090 type:complete len:92 (-) Transcript_1740:38-313(-)